MEARIDATTVHTRDEQRDGHLKSADFLDVEKFPEITFVSKKIAGADGEWKVTGDLTIHGVTKSVTLEVEGPAPEAKDPLGEREERGLGDDKNQSQGFRPGVERGTGNGRSAGGGRGRHHAGTGTVEELVGCALALHLFLHVFEGDAGGFGEGQQDDEELDHGHHGEEDERGGA